MPRKKYEYGMKESDWIKLPYLVRKRIIREEKLRSLEHEKNARLAAAIQVLPVVKVAPNSIYGSLNFNPKPDADEIKRIEKEVNMRIRRERY